VQGYRNALIYNRGIHWPDFFIFAIWFILSLVLGGWLFLRLKTHFAEVL
jgi:ABC-type polysaccharide/polyol phosphate export permease